jgi:hypothetical protein
MELPEIKVFDASQPVQNYLASKQVAINQARQNVADQQNAQVFSNSLADRETNLAEHAVDRGNALADAATARVRNTGDYNEKVSQRPFEHLKQIISARKDITEMGQQKILGLDTTKEGPKWDAQVASLADDGQRLLIQAGMSPVDAGIITQSNFTNGTFSRERIAAFQKAHADKLAKESQTTLSPGERIIAADGTVVASAPAEEKNSPAFNDLKAAFGRNPTKEEMAEQARDGKTSQEYNDWVSAHGRKPTGKELAALQASTSRGGDTGTTSEIKNVTDMVASGYVKNRKEGWEKVKLARENPTKEKMAYVLERQKAQAAQAIYPGNENYKDEYALRDEANRVYSSFGDGQDSSPAAIVQPTVYTATGPGGDKITSTDGITWRNSKGQVVK